MKNNRSITVGVVIFTIVVIIVIVGSQIGFPSSGAKTPTETDTSVPLSTATLDPCSPKELPATIAGLEKLSREFEDLYNVASVTASNQLTPLITELQRVRREADDYVVPSCLDVLKGYQINSMNSYIDALIALISALQVNVQPAQGMTQAQYDQAVKDALSPYYALANQKIVEGSNFTNQYVIEKARLLGVTLVPTPTALPLMPITPTNTP